MTTPPPPPTTNPTPNPPQPSVVYHTVAKGDTLYSISRKYGVAVDVRQGDFLAMDVHQWHCNTPLEHSKNTIEKGDVGRLSIVCYLRKNMIKCKTKKGKKSKKNK